jgi:polyisoprenoid-binding protein YceI
LWVEGDSTLHKFRLDAKELQIEVGTPEATAGQKVDELAAAGGIKTLDVRVAVRGLTSGESGLDDNMRSALKADRNHEIRFQMDSYQSSPGADASHLSLKLKVRLLIAGVETPIELDAAAAREGAALHVTGAKQLLMTDYGVKPPTFMLGAMSCKDAVSIHFDLRLEPTP